MVNRHEQLTIAVSKAQAGQVEDSLNSMLELWSTQACPELVEPILWLGEVVGKGMESLSERDAKTIDQITTGRSPADLNLVLEHLTSGTIKQAVERMEVLAQWPDDPRIDQHLVHLLEELPYRSTGSKKFWGRVYKRLTHTRDKTLLARLRKLQRHHEKTVAASMSAWLCSKDVWLLEKLSPLEGSLHALTDGEREILKELESLRPQESSSNAASQDSFLQSIYMDPWNDDPRLVFGDWLQEQGDPWGEFIAIQFAKLEGKQSREDSKRETELRKAYWERFVGPLSKTILKKDAVFEKGFLSACTTNIKRVRAHDVIGLPVWSTVKTFQGPPEIYRHAVMRSLRSLTFDRWNDDLVDFCGEKHSWRLEKFRCHIDEESEEALSLGKSLPNLKSLSLWNRASSLEDFRSRCQKVMAGETGQRLKHLVCLSFISSTQYPMSVLDTAGTQSEKAQPAVWQQILNSTPSTLEMLELQNGNFRNGMPYLTFSRDESGCFSRLIIWLDGLNERTVVETINCFPKDMVTAISCQFENKRNATKQMRSSKLNKVRKAVERLTNLGELRFPS